MATHIIPNRIGQIRQSNLNESQGEIIVSRNLDLVSKPDKIQTTPKLVRIKSESAFGNDEPVEMVLWDGKYIMVSAGELFTATDPAGTWGNANVTGDAFNLNSSACIFDGQLRITASNDVASWTGVTGAGFDDNWWTGVLSGDALTANVPHVCATVQSQKETFFVTDGHWVRYYEKDAASTQNVELAENHTASCLAPALNGSMWVGTFAEEAGKAHVYQIFVNEQVEGTTVYNQAYPVNAQAVLAIWVKDNIPFIVTEKGEIQQFNGAGFTTVAQFPFTFGDAYLDGVISGQVQNSNRARPIHPKGVGLTRDVAFIQLNSVATDGLYPINSKTSSGLWTFNHTTGQLSHYSSLCETTDSNGAYIQGSSGSILLSESTQGLVYAIADIDGNTGLYALTEPSSVGYFITPELTSDTVQEASEQIYHKAKTLAEGEAIYTLYRTTKRDTIQFLGNWLSTTMLTTEDDVSGLAVGDWITNLANGKWSVVKKIETGAEVTTITLKDAIGEASGTVYMMSDNFKLLGYDLETLTMDERNVYTSDIGEYIQLSANVTNGWVQFMVILDGDIEYRQFIHKGTAKNMV